MENASSLAVSSASVEVATASSLAEPSPKKKRNLPGMPDPDAEVIALSPKTLLATNRFVCEICNKGFQRDQNLQLHRRGHNLPWKLKQRTGGKDQVRKKVYVCPETTCVHHNPARALGDLTGIKKHFCRKHGEKKWKCERCSKKYAVQSDWKAHMKTCGTKEYKCDCGTLFSRRDSFITHRAFCDALAEESSRAQNMVQPLPEGNLNRAKAASNVASPPPPPLTPSTTVVSPVLSIQSSDLPENATDVLPPVPAVAARATSSTGTGGAPVDGGGGGFGSTYTSPTQLLPPQLLPQRSPSSLSNMVCPAVLPDQCGSLPSPSTTEPTSLSLFLSSTASSIFSRPEQNPRLFAPSLQPAMSATALLQKAAQMGAAASNSSLLRGLSLAMSSTSYSNDTTASTSNATHWGGHPKAENDDTAGHGLGLSLPSQESSDMSGLMMGQSSLFGTKPMTLDFLGLGMSPSVATTTGLSAFLTSLEGGFGAAPPTSFGGGGGPQSSVRAAWDGELERKPSGTSFL
ncbi:zinc finger protein GAI-ASSOCIATED FACTOR 1-like isoform X2 [Punica granatum]|uniref:C2H2-type domain-containing protein n=2 Tax=Punica granatum TaxID=22663 RepID=A0A218X824_PUNGR|nr:zinc finger protein GAI-ASSOCIATED FACTOR 1-like isoform X2 [Punica granatum]OWM80826.1 hypothetical protein CDL15_Pgr006857 [Punica granatum]PKI43742.1 hypothetical protein CRG98_035848 [Punica granatum]